MVEARGAGEMQREERERGETGEKEGGGRERMGERESNREMARAASLFTCYIECRFPVLYEGGS